HSLFACNRIADAADRTDSRSERERTGPAGPELHWNLGSPGLVHGLHGPSEFEFLLLSGAHPASLDPGAVPARAGLFNMGRQPAVNAGGACYCVTLHFAYGSNMCRARMRRRCPGAEPIGAAWLF